MSKEQSFGLFDSPPQTSNSEPNQDKLIVLDPTGLYDIPSNYVPITTDVEWIEFFGISSSACWVKGERLCKWAEAWLWAWNKMDTNVEIKQDPADKLAALFHPLPLPEKWINKSQLLNLVNRLNSYPQDNPIAHLLADITGSDMQVWLGEASIQHLAAWLAIKVPEECIPLEGVWQRQFAEHELASYYQTEDKLLLLRCWLGIAEPAMTALGKYPLPIPDFLTQEFDRYWEQLIFSTEGKVLDNLVQSNQVGMDRIAKIAQKVFHNRPNWIDKVKETKITPYLSHSEKVKLTDRQSPPPPQPLAIDATPQQALTWVTENYLPFRRWEMVIHQPPFEQRISERLADSFVEWMLNHYPEMKVDAVDTSYLNYSVASKVQNLCQSNPVLWVVVDGLGWLDHIELISLLTQNNQLAVDTYIEPRFTILPTITEYAKWSLYSQLLPNHTSWQKEDVKKAFAKMGLGKRYPDSRRAELRQDLKKGKHKLYCWDTTQLDELYHNQRDWQYLYERQRPHTLEGIAKEIISFVEEYSHPEQIKVVIASDHGQILGVSEKITHCPLGLEPQGRIAIGKADDTRFVVLSQERYGLPHDISIVRNSASLSSFSYTTNQKIIGSHGGLFPEEVVVGVSILRKSVQRLPVLIKCDGEGKPREQGELQITIDNPNSVPLTDLCLYINELRSFDCGKPLEKKIPPNQIDYSFNTTIPHVPELPPTHKGNHLSLSGKLTFRFPDNEVVSANLSSESKIIINQLFSSGFDSFDINEFG
jgi:hypothetical protein